MDSVLISRELSNKLSEQYKVSCEICGSYPELKYLKQFSEGNLLVDLSVIKSPTLEVICHAISQSVTPLTIEIMGNNYKTLGTNKGDYENFHKILKALSMTLKLSKNLSCLKFRNLVIPSTMMQNLCQGLSTTTHLNVLHFENCPMKRSILVEICSSVKNVPCISTLVLCNCRLDNKNIRIIKSLIVHQGLNRSDMLWKNTLRARHPNLDKMKGLRHLVLNDNPHIGDDGLWELLSVLSDDIWITGVELQNCGITSRSVEVISKLVQVNQVLQLLNLENNPFLDSTFILSISKILQKRNSYPKTLQYKRTTGTKKKRSCENVEKGRLKLMSKMKRIERGVPWRIEGRLLERKEGLPVGTLSLILGEIHKSEATKHDHKKDKNGEISLHHIRRMINHYKAKVEAETRRRLKAERKLKHMKRKVKNYEKIIEDGFILDEGTFLHVERCFSKFQALLNKVQQAGYQWQTALLDELQEDPMTVKMASITTPFLRQKTKQISSHPVTKSSSQSTRHSSSHPVTESSSQSTRHSSSHSAMMYSAQSADQLDASQQSINQPEKLDDSEGGKVYKGKRSTLSRVKKATSLRERISVHEPEGSESEREVPNASDLQLKPSQPKLFSEINRKSRGNEFPEREMSYTNSVVNVSEQLNSFEFEKSEINRIGERNEMIKGNHKSISESEQSAGKSDHKESDRNDEENEGQLIVKLSASDSDSGSHDAGRKGSTSEHYLESERSDPGIIYSNEGREREYESFGVSESQEVTSSVESGYEVNSDVQSIKEIQEQPNEKGSVVENSYKNDSSNSVEDLSEGNGYIKKAHLSKIEHKRSPATSKSSTSKRSTTSESNASNSPFNMKNIHFFNVESDGDSLVSAATDDEKLGRRGIVIEEDKNVLNSISVKSSNEVVNETQAAGRCSKSKISSESISDRYTPDFSIASSRQPSLSSVSQQLSLGHERWLKGNHGNKSLVKETPKKTDEPDFLTEELESNFEGSDLEGITISAASMSVSDHLESRN